MATIKKSHLKEVFLKYGLSEGIFDIFNKKRKKLDKDLKDVRAKIEDTINAAPNEREKKRLQDLMDAFRKAHAAGVKVY